jgi:hypothetical protein
MIEEMCEIKQPIRKKRQESEIFQDTKRAIGTHSEPPLTRFKINGNFGHFLSLSIRQLKEGFTNVKY